MISRLNKTIWNQINLTENVILSLQPTDALNDLKPGLQVKAYANFSDFAGTVDFLGFKDDRRFDLIKKN